MPDSAPGPVIPATIFDDLPNEVADGLLCVRENCRADFYLTGTPATPVGRSVTGSQVFACAPLCARAVLGETAGEQLAVACGPACCHPVTGDHADCPGPAGRTAVTR